MRQRPASDPPAARERLAHDLTVTRGLASGEILLRASHGPKDGIERLQRIANFSPRFARTEGFALSGDKECRIFLCASRGLQDMHPAVTKNGIFSPRFVRSEG